MKKATLFVDYALFIDCPYCREQNNLADQVHSDEGKFTIPIFNNKWNDLKDEEVECDSCDEIFQIKSVET